MSFHFKLYYTIDLWFYCCGRSDRISIHIHFPLGSDSSLATSMFKLSITKENQFIEKAPLFKSSIFLLVLFLETVAVASVLVIFQAFPWRIENIRSLFNL